VEGTPFGRYRLIELLGRGGMGEVWRGHDTATNNRTVAIKLLPQLASDHSAEASHEFAKNPPRCPLQPLPWPATTTGSSEGLRSSQIHQSESRRR
jgi:serine/threonine protein kinase